MIELKNLSRRFDDFDVFTGVNAKLANGKIFVLYGEAGVGKTVLMRLLSGVLAPNEGDVRINGFSVVTDLRKCKPLFGYAPESFAGDPFMTPYEYLRFIAGVKGIESETASRQIRELSELLHLDPVKDTPLCKLPPEVRAYVNFGQALLGNPDFLFLDDPARGLGSLETRELYSLLENLKGKKTIVLALTDPEPAAFLADEFLCLRDGTLESFGSLSEDPCRDGTEDGELPAAPEPDAPGAEETETPEDAPDSDGNECEKDGEETA
ncbi:MAG: ATP-binding cassette domain-containing protein [Clostridia bacterium]|nr:ATP-binding cassette domain-containing protein [Clostridia bacterium]